MITNLSCGSSLSRTQVLLTKISQTCQDIRDIKKRRKQLVFHKTSNTFKRTTSYSSPPIHNSPHSSTGGGGARDDNAKKSSSSTSSSPGGTHNPDIPACRDLTSPAPDPAPTSRSPSPDGRPHSPPPADEEGSSPASCQEYVYMVHLFPLFYPFSLLSSLF